MIRKTGNRRFRALKRWFRRPLLVLQVEIEVSWPAHRLPREGSIPAENVPAGRRFEWKDARVEDLMSGPMNFTLQTEAG